MAHFDGPEADLRPIIDGILCVVRGRAARHVRRHAPLQLQLPEPAVASRLEGQPRLLDSGSGSGNLHIKQIDLHPGSSGSV